MRAGSGWACGSAIKRCCLETVAHGYVPGLAMVFDGEAV